MGKLRYRADHVGSLLRGDDVKAARAAHFDTGELSSDGLRDIEDARIDDVVRRQQAVGLKVVTDGEVRRRFWHYDFMAGLVGLNLVERSEGVQFAGVRLPPIYPVIDDLFDFPDDHPMLDHYRYLASVTEVQPKISIPGPSCCHFRTAKPTLRRRNTPTRSVCWTTSQIRTKRRFRRSMTQAVGSCKWTTSFLPTCVIRSTVPRSRLRALIRTG